MKSEQLIQTEIRAELSKNNHIVFRANVGKVQMIDGRWFDTGLPKGFFDLFGFRSTDKKIFFIEVKNDRGRPRDVQIRFHEFLVAQGAIHGIARSADEAIMIVEEGLIGYGFKNILQPHTRSDRG